MTLCLGPTLKRLSASLMLVLAMVYLMHAAWHTALGEVAIPPSGAAVILELDPFIFAEGQTGDGVVGCHFFCNHGCPVPPLPHIPALEAPLPTTTYASAKPCQARVAHLQPIKAPPRLRA